ncbi:MAG: hypothetical protein DHS20C03_27080 [Minwuia thermotolerans]|nr:MAG: hypothetical protein DHS20C03_27080 [Minwuia thermotolerans]
MTNGVPVWVGGLSPDEVPLWLQPDGHLWLQFALQNLNFDGRDMGCDTINLDLQFMKNGEPVGDQISLRRSYIALRNAKITLHKTTAGSFSWEGRYRQGSRSQQVATEAFLGNRRFTVSRAIAENPALLAQALEGMREKWRKTFEWNQEWFRNQGFTAELDGQDMPLTLVIRPPLTIKSSKDGTKFILAYGLAVAVRHQPSQQVQFTFTADEVRGLRERVLELRNERVHDISTGQTRLTRRAKGLATYFDRLNTRDGLPGFAYTIKGSPGDTNPPGLCRYMGDAG